MVDLSWETKAKFRAFHEAYERERQIMLADDVQGAVIAVQVWDKALRTVPLTRDELMRYKLRLAMRSVTGGELFAD